jgi:hypothetical protein
LSPIFSSGLPKRTQPLAPKGAVPHWLRLQREFAGEVANGRYLQADAAGHYIHKNMPDLVVREIKAVVEAVRNGELEGPPPSVRSQWKWR